MRLLLYELATRIARAVSCAAYVFSTSTLAFNTIAHVKFVARACMYDPSSRVQC